jgi:hypothetical protein
MPQGSCTPATSFSTLISTIKDDQHVFRWFMHLIEQPAVKTELVREENIRGLYAQLRRNLRYQYILYPPILIALSIAFLQHQYLIGGVGMILIYFYYAAHQKIRKCVSSVSTRLIAQDFDETSLHEKTLYQIGEFYSRKYKIKSLVHSITSVDAPLRTLLFCSLFFVLVIHPGGFWYYWLVIVGTYDILNTILNTPFIYKILNRLPR